MKVIEGMMTVSDMAVRLKITNRQVWAMITRGQIPQPDPVPLWAKLHAWPISIGEEIVKDIWRKRWYEREQKIERLKQRLQHAQRELRRLMGNKGGHS